MPLNSPIPLPRLLETLTLAGLKPDDHVLDLGCGEGDLLRAVCVSGVTGLGVDLDPAAIATAQNAQAGPALSWMVGDVAELEPSTVGGPSSLAICLGSTHAYGRGNDALPQALRALSRLVRPGGFLLVGEGFRRGDLPPAYRQLLGTPTGIERTLVEVVCTAEDAGLECHHAVTATPAEWEAFEWAFWRRKRAALRTSGDTDRLASLRTWRNGFLQWGREHMGFVAMLLQTPPAT